MRRLSRNILILLVLAFGIAAIANEVSPHGIAWSGNWHQRAESQANDAGLIIADTAEAQEVVAHGEYLVFDARNAKAFAASHLPGAISFPAEEINEAYETLRLLITPDQPVMVYCGGAACDDSITVGSYLKEQGVEEVLIYVQGFEAWTAADLSTESGL